MDCEGPGKAAAIEVSNLGERGSPPSTANGSVASHGSDAPNSLHGKVRSNWLSVDSSTDDCAYYASHLEAPAGRISQRDVTRRTWPAPREASSMARHAMAGSGRACGECGGSKFGLTWDGVARVARNTIGPRHSSIFAFAFAFDFGVWVRERVRMPRPRHIPNPNLPQNRAAAVLPSAPPNLHMEC